MSKVNDAPIGPPELVRAPELPPSLSKILEAWDRVEQDRRWRLRAIIEHLGLDVAPQPQDFWRSDPQEV